jgi:Protein of unknown function (DUF3168)
MIELMRQAAAKSSCLGQYFSARLFLQGQQQLLIFERGQPGHIPLIADGIFQLLSDNAALSALLAPSGSRSDGTSGVFSIIGPKEVNLPYVVFQQISLVPVISFDGVNELQEGLWQFSCYAASYKTARLVADAVANVLNGFLGVLADGTLVEGVYPEAERDSFEEPTPNPWRRQVKPQLR